MARVECGKIVLWEGGALWRFKVTDDAHGRTRTDTHAHHAIQISLALDGEFKLHTDSHMFQGPGVAVSPDRNHAFEPRGSIALLFIDPDTGAGRAVLDGLSRGEDAAHLSHDQTMQLCSAINELAARSDSSDGEWRALGQSLVEMLVGPVETTPVEARIAETLQWAPTRLEHTIGISEAARHVGLSPDRMSHLFVQQTGLPFRTYVLWLRLQKAVEAYARGSSLTMAAHDAGFADSAHFSRTFRRMFGIRAGEFHLL